MIGLWGWIILTNNHVIKEIVAGNGNGFSNKEILQAHIRDDNEFKKEMRNEFSWVKKQFINGSDNITENKEGIKSLRRTLTYGIGPLIFLILGWLAIIQLIK